MHSENPPFTRTEAELFVRMWNLYFNRTVAYAPDHPVVLETIPKLVESLNPLLRTGSIAFLLQEFGFYIGHIDIVYQPNNRKIADHLKRFGIESVSLTAPVNMNDLHAFLDACSLTHANPEAFARYIMHRGVTCVSVNNVSLQTVREGETISSSEGQNLQAMALDKVIENSSNPSNGGFDDLTMRVVLGHLTAREFSANLDMLRVLEDPTALPRTMTEVSARAKPEDQAYALRQSLQNVLGTFSASAKIEGAPIEELLAGMYSMRSELLKALKAQQGINRQLQDSNEVTRSTDDIFIRTAADLILSELERNKGNNKKTAAVIQRIVPEKQHLQQVLAVIRQEFQKRGLPLMDYYNLLGELNLSMGSSESYAEFLKAGESVGLQPDELVREIQENPKQAAQLIVLASEMRKSGKMGAAEDMIRQLTEYVEKTGDALSKRAESQPQEALRLAGMMQQLENEVNRELSERDVPEDTRLAGRQKLRLRLQQSLGDIKTKAAFSQMRNPQLSEELKAQFILELFGDEKEMDASLDVLKQSLVQDEITKEISDRVLKKVRSELNARREKTLSKDLPAGVYVKAVLDFFIKFEVSRATRYNLPFCALLLSFQGLPEEKEAHEKQGESIRGLQNVLIGDLRRSMRDADFVGYLSFNRFLVVLPMTPLTSLPPVLKKFRESLTRQLGLPDGSRIWVRPRCGMAGFDRDTTNTYQKIYAELVKSWQADA